MGYHRITFENNRVHVNGTPTMLEIKSVKDMIVVDVFNQIGQLEDHERFVVINYFNGDQVTIYRDRRANYDGTVDDSQTM